MLSSLLCLSLAVYHEARGEPIEGQEAVAEVVINRSEARHKSVCAVVYEPSQFSWVGHVSPPRDVDAWHKSVEVAQKCLKEPPNHTDGAQYFRSNKMRVPYKATNIISIGNHVFFNQ